MRHTNRLKESALPLPYDPEREFASASYRTKQLIILATDVLLGDMSIDQEDPQALAAQLIEARLLPGCYRSRYGESFLQTFRHVLELTRNLLVSDSPFLPNTLAELAARAIFKRARLIVAGQGIGWQGAGRRARPAPA